MKLIRGDEFLKMKFQCETCESWECLYKSRRVSGPIPKEVYFGKCKRYPPALTYWTMTCNLYKEKRNERV